MRGCGPRNPTRGTLSACCARARNGHVSAALQATRPMNSRRLMLFPPGGSDIKIVAIFARAQEGGDVRFGSKADICSARRHVRFPSESGHVQCTRRCPVCANSGHCGTYSITSSAATSNDGGIVRPSAFAVLRLTVSSTFVDCWTGKSAGFSPLRMRPV